MELNVDKVSMEDLHTIRDFKPHAKPEFRKLLIEEGKHKQSIYRGVHCILRRNGMGNWCGYVRAKDFDLSDFEDNDDIEANLEDRWDVFLHGGITWVDTIDKTNDVYIGFDSSHVGDLSPIVLTPFERDTDMIPGEKYFTLHDAYECLFDFIDQARKLNKVIGDDVYSVTE